MSAVVMATPAPGGALPVAGPVRGPVLRWFGGKWRLAPAIIAHMPPHRVYVEPFAGAASVLLRKPRAYAEVINDLDGEVVNLFQVLRDPAQAGELERLLRLTPYARAEFEAAFTPQPRSGVERARCTVIRAFMGYASDSARMSNGPSATGFRANSNRSGSTPAHDWARYPDRLASFCARLQGVVVERRDALEVMAMHDGPSTLHYVDPPYVSETRGRGGYAHELDDDGHARLLEALLGLRGMVLLSGYRCPLYDTVLAGWRRVDWKAYADGARERTESLWLNPAAVAAGATGPDLFAAGGAA